ncbi:MAG: D-alanyl-D-alanine carboxypeptidase family protein [Firmicutes bacterium]|nr:D-alanyl-D-alanine carboxypeptidase family protein [Bacillota bacterium]
MTKLRKLPIFVLCLSFLIVILFFFLVVRVINMFDKISQDQMVSLDVAHVPIIEGVKDIFFDGKSELDLFSHLHFKEGNKETIEIKTKGEYNLTINGIYNLFYVIRSVDGYLKEIPFKLIVNIDKGNPNYKVSYKSVTPKGYELTVKDGVSIVKNNIIINKSYSIPRDYVPSNLVSISTRCEVVNYVKDAFDMLVSDAFVTGLNIYPSTCYRSYTFQEILFKNYVIRDGQEYAEKYSARPGYSEHQSGLAIDVNTVNNAFSYTAESAWLNDNCYKYGFIIRYPKDKENITGYQYEPWHIRYVGNILANILYNNGSWLTLEEYYGLTSVYDK